MTASVRPEQIVLNKATRLGHHVESSGDREL